MRFVTDPSRKEEDRSAYLELLRRTFLDFEIEGDDVEVDSTMLRLPGVGINATKASAFRTLRTQAMSEGADQRGLLICLDGQIAVSHLGRKLTIGAGMATLLSTADAVRADRSRTRHVIIVLSRTALASIIPDLDSALMRPMDAALEPFHLLHCYLRFLAKALPAQPGLQHIAASHVCDLVAAAIDGARGVTFGTNENGVSAARLWAIKHDVERSFASGDVSSQALARRHGISARYIRKLFEGEGTSLSRFVLARRLEKVHRMLTSLQDIHLPIGNLAYDAGFGDLSTFNHAFRKRYGMTPSDVREIARTQIQLGER